MQLYITLHENVQRIDQGRFFRDWDLVTGPQSQAEEPGDESLMSGGMKGMSAKE